MSEQLYYTYSTIGSGSTTGERIRAQSSGVGSATSEPVRALMKYLTYRLPAGADLRTPVEVAPLSLVLAKTPYHRILSHKKCVDRDGIGRAGNFFTHAIINPEGIAEQTGASEPISAYAAISLWKSPFWKTSEDQAPPKDTKIESLSPQDIHKYTNTTWQGKLSLSSLPLQHPSWPLQVKDCLPLIFSAFLMLKKLNKKHLCIAAPADMVATLIWCITRCLPRTLTIMQELTFSTYEFDITRSTTTITGTCWLPPANHSGPFTPQTDLPRSCYQDQPNLVINCYTQRQTHFEIDERVHKFAQFVTTALFQKNEQKLDQLITQAEGMNYREIEDVLTLFRIQQEEATKETVQDILINPRLWPCLQYPNIQDTLIELIGNQQQGVNWQDWWKTEAVKKIQEMYQWSMQWPESKEAEALRTFVDRVTNELCHDLRTNRPGSDRGAMYWDQLLKTISSDNPLVWTRLPQGLSQLPYTQAYQLWWQRSGKSIAQELYQIVHKKALVGEYQQLAISLQHWWQRCAEYLRQTWVQRQDMETGFWLDILSTIQPPGEGDQHWKLLLKDLDSTLPQGEIPINWCEWEIYKALLLTWHLAQEPITKTWLFVDWKYLPHLSGMGLPHTWKKFALEDRILRFQGQPSDTIFSFAAKCAPLIHEVLADLIRNDQKRDQAIRFCESLLQNGYTHSDALLVSILPASFPYQGLAHRLLETARLPQEQLNELLTEILHNMLTSQQDAPSWLIENYLSGFSVQSINPDKKRFTQQEYSRARDILNALLKDNQMVPAKLRPYISCWCAISDFFSQPVFDPATLHMIHDRIKAVRLSKVTYQEVQQEMLDFLSTHVETHTDILAVIETFSALLLQAPSGDLPAHALLLQELAHLQGKSSIDYKKIGEYIQAVLAETIHLSEAGIAQKKQTQFVDECLNSLLASVEISYISPAQWPTAFISLWNSYLSRYPAARSTSTTNATKPVSLPVQDNSVPANGSTYNQDNLPSPPSTTDHQQQIPLSGPSQKKPLPPRPIPHAGQRSIPHPNKLKIFFGKRSGKHDSLEDMVKTFNKAIKSKRATEIAAAYNETIANRPISKENRDIAIMSKQIIEAYNAYRMLPDPENKARFLAAYDTISKYTHYKIIIEQEMHEVAVRIRN
jgi:hypothetical protein